MEVLFWLRSRKTQKIVHLRITALDENLNVSTGIAAIPEHWLGSDNLFNPISKINIEYNNQLSQIRADILRAYNDLTAERRNPTPGMILERYQNNKVSYNPIANTILVPTIEEVMLTIIKNKRQQLGKEIGKATFQRYFRLQKRLSEYLKESKIPLYSDVTKLNEATMKGFFGWLSDVKGYSNPYVNKHRDYMILFLELANKASRNDWKLDWIVRDIPLLSVEEPEIVKLTFEQYEKFKEQKFIGSLERVHDMFVFMAETGVHIADYRRIRAVKVIDIDDNGNSWASMKREKSKVKFDVYLTKTALSIIEKYGSLAKLPIMADQKYNDHLKLLGIRANLDIELTSKVARKTFCHIHLNKHKTRTDITAKLMGLTSDRCIKHYGTIMRDTIGEELMKKYI